MNIHRSNSFQFSRFIVCILIAANTMLFAGSTVEFPVRIHVYTREHLRQVQQVVRYIEDYSPYSGEMKAYVDSDGNSKLIMLGYNPVQLIDTSAINAAYAIAHPEDVMYHNYTQLTSWAHTLASSYPSIVALDSLGPSVEGRWLWLLRITDYPDIDEYEPELVYISTMHGDEPPGTEFLIWLLDSLTQKYGSDANLTRIVDSLDLWVIPLMNPDGNFIADRENANGVDLNRNFPVPDGTVGYDGTYAMEIETEALIDFLSQRQQTLTINFHTGALVTNYPWDFDIKRAPDDNLLIDRSIAYSIRNAPMYSGGFPQGITNGYDWYEVDGSMQDWDYHTCAGIHLTVELCNTKWPDDSQLPGLWADNYEAMVHILELALSGIHGIVSDSVTGEPIDAYVWFEQPRRWVRTDMPIGDFHHQFLAGTHSLTAVADNYYPRRYTGIYLPHDSASVYLAVRLIPADTIFFSDFEIDNGGLYTQSFECYQDWEHGIPTLSSPYAPEYIPSGVKLWTTELSGEYSDSSQSRLILDVDLSEHDEAALVFDEWYRFQGVDWSSASPVAHDAGHIAIATASDTTPISPPWGYDCITSEWNWLIPEGDSVFADDEPGTPWHKTVFFLDDFCGQSISIIWDFGSSNMNVQLGWYIDNLVVIAPSSSLDATHAKRNTPENCALRVEPNPFNSTCRIELDGVDESATWYISVIDLNGRIVKTSAMNSTSLFYWDASGQTSGIYLLRAQSSRGKSIERTIMLIR